MSLSFHTECTPGNVEASGIPNENADVLEYIFGSSSMAGKDALPCI